MSQSISRTIPVVLFAVACALVLSACKTEQKITTKSRKYAIDQGAWEKSGEKDDSEELREKFGTSYRDAFGDDEDGDKAKLSSLQGKMFNDRGRDISGREFRGVREVGESGNYKTPEYLKRQEFKNRKGEVRDSDQEARYGQVAVSDIDQSFRGGEEEVTFWQKLNPFRKKRSTPAREASQVFSAADYKPGNRAQNEARTPVPMASFGSGIGDYRDRSISMDDVRKLVSPEAFR
jgi:hypothetical protein